MSSTWQQFFVTTEPATESSPGAVAYGTFAVDGTKIRVRNDRGKLIGTAELDGGDPKVIACRILRGSRASSDFNRPLPAARVPY